MQQFGQFFLPTFTMVLNTPIALQSGIKRLYDKTMLRPSLVPFFIMLC
jgi:hypothetical protein